MLHFIEVIDETKRTSTGPNICQIWWKYLKPRPAYYDLKLFKMAVLTLNFDLDLSKLSKVNSFVLLWLLTPVPKIWWQSDLYFGGKSHTNEGNTNKPTNGHDHNTSLVEQVTTQVEYIKISVSGTQVTTTKLSESSNYFKVMLNWYRNTEMKLGSLLKLPV